MIIVLRRNFSLSLQPLPPAQLLSAFLQPLLISPAPTFLYR